jgi:hypothetical protein
VGQTSRRGFLTLFALFALLASDELFAAQTPPNWKSDWEATQKAAEKEGRLVIYGPTGVDQQKLYTEVFQQAFPKIKVNYTPGRISEIISHIMAEQRAGIRQADHSRRNRHIARDIKRQRLPATDSPGAHSPRGSRHDRVV